MLDIETLNNGGRVIDSDLFKAQNLLTTQKGSLYYLSEFGINLDMFFSQNYNIQFESFKSYITDAMAQNGINIVGLGQSIETFTNTLLLTIGGSKDVI